MKMVARKDAGDAAHDHQAPGQAEAGATPPQACPQRAEKLRIECLSKHYGDTCALEPTDLAVRQGEFVTLLGPSGSGKTTLLMMIAGLVPPTSGSIWIEQKDATRAPPYRRDIGMMFQSYALFPHMTVGENIAFPLRMRNMGKEAIAREVDAILALIKLPGIRDRFPAQLSGGQQQRVALARAIVHKPSIVLMDEPLAALDKSLRIHMQAEIRQLQKQLGITVLYVTHDQEEAMTMSDRICLMNNARIEQIGTPESLYFAPQSLFAGQFLGESNCLRGVLESVDGERQLACLRTASGQQLRGRLAQAVEPGHEAVMLVRPESLRVSMSVADSSANHLPCRIEDSVVMGSLSRQHVVLADGQRLVAVGLTRAGRAEGAGSSSAVHFNEADAMIFGAQHG
ncbi:ABC transporter ATP-binding protein [Cupriavidus sp. 2TAF22]|uniref:ABC transporter ATP-binding protein n=1 Tax=unclassified Cupriavidus TaxID=2640874 RepID=UPI003F8EC7F6